MLVIILFFLSSETPAPDSITDVYFEEIGYQKTAVFKLTQLKPGHLIEGSSIFFKFLYVKS